MDGIVLRTIDIGEADRLCILFTREAGLLPARAKAVRKTGSRMGGSLLPMRKVQMEIVQTEHSAIITGARNVAGMEKQTPAGGLNAFMRFGQAAELVLTLTEEGEPMPRVFQLLSEFADIADGEGDPLPAFHFRLLFLLGLLPFQSDDRRFANLSESARLCLAACTGNAPLSNLLTLPLNTDELNRFRTLLIQENLQRPLKSGGFSLSADVGR